MALVRKTVNWEVWFLQRAGFSKSDVFKKYLIFMTKKKN